MLATIDVDYASLAQEIIIKLLKDKQSLKQCKKDLIKVFEAIADNSRVKERERCAGIAFSHHKDCHDHGPCIADSILYEDLDFESK